MCHLRSLLSGLAPATVATIALCVANTLASPAAVPASRPQNVAIMIHGAGGGGWEYDRWRPVFERAGWRVIACDLIPAPKGLAATRFNDYVKQVRSWVPQKRGRLAFVGASMGGILALKAAETLHPDAIVLVDSVPPTGVGPKRKQKPNPPIIRWANGPLKDTRDAMPDSDEATILWAHPRWRDESGAVMDAIFGGIAARKPTAPTLVVLGQRDTDVPMASGLAIAQWASADVHLYNATSHVGPLMGRRAAEIADATCRWLSARLPAH